MKHVKITSFGYGHGPAPEADIILDVRKSLRNPHHDTGMRDLNAQDKRVRGHVMGTPGAVRLVSDVANLVQSLLEVSDTVSVAIGCVGGRHRAPALVMSLEVFLAIVAEDIPVEIAHRDMDRPVLPAKAHAEEPQV